MMNKSILFLANPNSIHDLKWISYFSKVNSCYLITRNLSDHIPKGNLEVNDIKYLGNVSDFSTSRFWKNKAEVKKIKQWINKNNIDIIHLLFTEPNVLWALYKKNFDIPIVATTRGSDILITIKNTLKRKSLIDFIVSRLYKKAFKTCDKITCTSGLQKNQVLKLGVPDNKIHLIKTGIDLEFIDLCLKKSSPGLLKGPYILFPRNMRQVYNHELSIEAIHLLDSNILNKYSFVFIDADSQYQEYVQKIKSLMNEVKRAKIYFLNSMNQPELISLMQKASLAVMTNTSDGSPVSAMELMYLKTPLVLSPLAYDKDIFGQIPKFAKFDPGALAYSITDILTNNKIKNDLLNAQQEIVVKSCNRTIEMNKLQQLYQSLL